MCRGVGEGRRLYGSRGGEEVGMLLLRSAASWVQPFAWPCVPPGRQSSLLHGGEELEHVSRFTSGILQDASREVLRLFLPWAVRPPRVTSCLRVPLLLLFPPFPSFSVLASSVLANHGQIGAAWPAKPWVPHLPAALDCHRFLAATGFWATRPLHELLLRDSIRMVRVNWSKV